MSAWQRVALGRIVDPVERPEPPIGGIEYRQIGVRLWGEGAYERETIDGNQTKYNRLFRTATGDIIVNKIWARNGSVAVVSDTLDGCYASSEFPMFAPHRDKLMPRWFHWYTKTKELWRQCDEKSQGTSGKNRIRPEKFLEVTIPLPPLAEQQRIVARVDALAARIEEAKGLRAQAMAEVASAPSAVHLFYAGNREVELGKVLDLFEDQVPVFSDRSYPQVGIRGFGEGLFDRETLSGHQTSYRYFNRLYPGAVVLSQVKGWEGAIAVCDVKFAGRFASPEYRTFRCREDCVLPEYLKAIVSTPWFLSKLSSITRGIGARRQRVRPEKFLELTVEMPSVVLQRRALPMFEKLDAVKRLQAETQAELDALLPSVLDRAFRTEL